MKIIILILCTGLILSTLSVPVSAAEFEPKCGQYTQKFIESYQGKTAGELYKAVSLRTEEMQRFHEPPPVLRYVEFKRNIDGKIRKIQIEFHPNKSIIGPIKREVLEKSALLIIYGIMIEE